MNEYRALFHVLSTFVGFFILVQAKEAVKCEFSKDAKVSGSDKLITNISSLIGKKFYTEKDGYNYEVAICSDVLKDHELASVIRHTKGKDDVLVLGRRNDTQITSGDTWLILKFGSGDLKQDDKKCLGQRTSFIYIVCHSEGHKDEPTIELAEDDGCSYRFVLPTSEVCDHTDDISHLKIFLIVVAVSFTVYCLVGIAYKRFLHRGQRCQQIPHFKFWSTIGTALADACDYVCRCDYELEDSWNNITSNFDGGDRDDVLLRP